MQQVFLRFTCTDAVKVFEIINHVFDYLPIAAVVNNKYFAVHGGLSPDLINIEQINRN